MSLRTSGVLLVLAALPALVAGTWALFAEGSLLGGVGVVVGVWTIATVALNWRDV